MEFLNCHLNDRLGDIMLIGYMRVSKSDGSQVLNSQKDALLAAGVLPEQIYQDCSSGKNDNFNGLFKSGSQRRYADCLEIR